MRVAPMRPKSTLILAVVGAALLSGCGGGGLLNRDRPDEFAVQRQTPLVVPPDFALTPPKPGEPRPVDRSLQRETLDALFGGPAPRSELETSALEKAGSADPGIRSAVGDPATFTVDKGTTTQAIVAAPEGDGQAASAVIPG